MSKNFGAPPPPVSEPKRTRQRRKHARPGEIVAAATQIFGEHGYGTARLEDVARLAGVSKGTLFFYFPNKEELFRAVVKAAIATHLERMTHIAQVPDRPIGEFVPLLLELAAHVGHSGIPPMARLIISESRSFPDLARVWHDEVVSQMLGMLTGAITRAQDRGEVCEGDPQLYAFSLLGPMMMGALFREVFKGSEMSLPRLEDLAKQHARTILDGLQHR